VPRPLKPEAYAAYLQGWWDADFNVDAIEAAQATMDREDRPESQARVHSVSGSLARTIHVIQPRVKDALRRGEVRVSLAAGSKSKANGVPYASVVQTGTVYGGGTRIKPHLIRPRHGFALVLHSGGRQIILYGGVQHPGAQLTPHPYLAVNEPRVLGRIDTAIAASAKKAEVA
jgi:hypothetical protein